MLSSDAVELGSYGLSDGRGATGIAAVERILRSVFEPPSQGCITDMNRWLSFTLRNTMGELKMYHDRPTLVD